MRVVILGCGRTGANLAAALANQQNDVTVIDSEAIALGRLPTDFKGKLVVGTGIDEDVLRRAGIEQAEAFVAVTNWDNTNIMAAQVARDIFGVKRVICRVYDPLRVEIYQALGLETICPTLLGVHRIQEILAS